MDSILRQFGLSDQIISAGDHCEAKLKERFAAIDKMAEHNQWKVIAAMQKAKVSANCFQFSSGYGYDDIGRDKLEEVYANLFHADSAIVRPQIACGTHALSLALSGVLRPGDELLSVTGTPYDTLQEVIGIRPSKGSLAEFGITYREVSLLPDGHFDFPAIREAIGPRTRMAAIQRSRGYAQRPSLGVEEIGDIISFMKEIKPDIVVMVDNCYGEFVEADEPGDVGADLTVGSLIKNPGGGLAPMGGYIAGRSDLIETCGYRLTAPGLGREVGASLGVLQSLYQGLFLAPTVTASALKSAIFASHLFSLCGFTTNPLPDETRHDIIQSVVLNSPERLEAFCRGIQKAAPVDSHVTPIPWPMPGYDCDVIMAAGAFNQGSSIELSADGPMREPYAVYFQGGLTWPHGKLGILMALQELADAGVLPELKL